MGWTYCYDHHKATDVRDDMRRQLGGLLPPQPTRKTHADEAFDALCGFRQTRGILKDALVAYGHRYYAAFQPGDGSVTIVCCLFNHGKGRSDDADCWGYKDMSESCGPCDVDCPLSILNLATDPAPNEWAKEWRAKVRAYWGKRADAFKTFKQLTIGAKVMTTDGIYTVTNLKPLQGHLERGGYYRIPIPRILHIVQTETA